jgi:hypothetical protein
MPEITIDDVKSRHEDELLELPNVTGVGIGERGGKPVIKVFVTHQVPQSMLGPRERVPASVEGYEVDVEEIGVILAETTEEEN